MGDEKRRESHYSLTLSQMRKTTWDRVLYIYGRDELIVEAFEAVVSQKCRLLFI